MKLESVKEFTDLLISAKRYDIVNEQQDIILEELDPRVKEKICIGGIFLANILITLLIALRNKKMDSKQVKILLMKNQKFNLYIQKLSKEIFNNVIKDEFFKKYVSLDLRMDAKDAPTKIPIIKIDAMKMWQDVTGYNNAEEYEKEINYEEEYNEYDPIHPKFKKVLARLNNLTGAISKTIQTKIKSDIITVNLNYQNIFYLHDLGCYKEYPAEKFRNYIVIDIKLKEYKNAKELEEWVDKNTNGGKK